MKLFLKNHNFGAPAGQAYPVGAAAEGLAGWLAGQGCWRAGWLAGWLTGARAQNNTKKAQVA